MEFPLNNYPTKAETDGEVLYRSLGSFWTHVFQERGTLRGFTLGTAEEIIQRYYSLLDAVNSFAVDDVPLFKKEKWIPLQLLRSKLNTEPFTFKPDDAVFGPQPELDTFYSNIIFQFGFPKIPIANVFTYSIGSKFVDVPLIADKVVSPSLVLSNKTDFILEDGTLFFNTNIFDNPNLVRIPVIGENGVKVTFTNTQGEEVDEELLILWAYHGEINDELLYKNFGYIFDLKRNNDAEFKQLLTALFDLHVDGPTVNVVKATCASFLGIKPVLNTLETIESIFDDAIYHYVVTDKETYRFPLVYNLQQDIKVGRTVSLGDIMVDAIEYYDNVSYSKGWWKKGGVLNKKLALSQFLFFGDYSNQLIFSNDLEIVSLDDDGNIVFPVEGVESDIELFHSFINDVSRQATIKAALELDTPGQIRPIYPVDWLMENFLKINSAVLKFRFTTDDLQSKFLSLLPILKRELPPYIYLIFVLDLNVEMEQYNNFANSITITFTTGDELLNADGSNEDGYIEKLEPYDYKSISDRLFEISRGVIQENLEYIASADADEEHEATITAAETDGRLMTVKDGGPIKSPPTPVTSTLEFNTLLLLDFS